MKNILSHLRTYVFRGIVAVIPIGLTYFVVRDHGWAPRARNKRAGVEYRRSYQGRDIRRYHWSDRNKIS